MRKSSIASASGMILIVSVACGKKPLQAYVAVMRKLLHAIYGMFTTNTDFVAEKFYAVATEIH